MKWRIHHVNIPAHDVLESRRFYEEILGLEDGPGKATVGTAGVDLKLNGRVSFLGDGNRGVHLTKPIPDFSKNVGLPINPTVGGHFAISVEDIGAVKKSLDDAGVFYVSPGQYAMPGVEQIYLYDPSGNLIEINGDRGASF